VALSSVQAVDLERLCGGGTGETQGGFSSPVVMSDGMHFLRVSRLGTGQTIAVRASARGAESLGPSHVMVDSITLLFSLFPYLSVLTNIVAMDRVLIHFPFLRASPSHLFRSALSNGKQVDI